MVKWVKNWLSIKMKWVNLLPGDKIIDWSKLKHIADDILKRI